MKWRQHSPYCQKSDCDRYSIARVTVGGVNQYEAWHRTGSNWIDAINLACRLRSADEAKRICEQHSTKR